METKREQQKQNENKHKNVTDNGWEDDNSNTTAVRRSTAIPQQSCSEDAAMPQPTHRNLTAFTQQYYSNPAAILQQSDNITTAILQQAIDDQRGSRGPTSLSQQKKSQKANQNTK